MAEPSLSYEEALAAVLARARPLGSETVPLAQAPGRVLAQDAVAGRDDPPAPKSAMDGFALRAADSAAACGEAPVTLAYGEVVGAGALARGRVAPGGAVRIMTGALLPEGADAVVKQEDTQAAGPGRFRVTRPLAGGENVVPRGARSAAGERLLAAGQVIGPQAVGVLAGLGLASVAVFRRPRVALLALGNELVDVGRPLAPGQIHVSNLYALEALAARHGAEIRRLGILGDDPAPIVERLAPCLERAGADACDVIVTLGGSHQGDFDPVRAVLEQLGATPLFNRTRINLGGSTRFASQGAVLCFGLPGTPGAAWGAYELLVRPALWRLAGRARLEHPLLPARLTHDLRWRAGPPGVSRRHFAPVRLDFGPDSGLHSGQYSGAGVDPPLAHPIKGRHSFETPAAPLPDGLALCPPEGDFIAAGETVAVMWLGEP
jgi:molybdopterin molybdotransferase